MQLLLQKYTILTFLPTHEIINTEITTDKSHDLSTERRLDSMHETQGQPYPDNAPETAPENPGRSRKIRIRILNVAVATSYVKNVLVVSYVAQSVAE